MSDHTMQARKPDTFGVEYGSRMLAEQFIGGLHDLAEHLGVDVKHADTPEGLMNRIRWHMRKSTASAVVIGFVPFSNGEGLSHIELQAQCPGTSYVFLPVTLALPCSCVRFDMGLASVDQQGSSAWNSTHGCEGCGEPDPATGWRRVDVNCPNCGGTGIVQP